MKIGIVQNNRLSIHFDVDVDTTRGDADFTVTLAVYNEFYRKFRYKTARPAFRKYEQLLKEYYNDNT